MGRDERFEVQFLLSLIAVVLGLTASNFAGLISVSVGLGFFFVAAGHLVLLISYYTLEQGTETNLDVTLRIKEISVWTLRFTTLGFLYLLFHILAYVFLRDAATAVFGLSSTQVQKIITFGLPFLVVMAPTGAFTYLVYSPLRASRDLSLNVVPEDIRLYPEYEANDPVLVEILNEGESEYTLTATVELPEGIFAKIDWEEHTSEYTEEFTLSGERKPINIQLRHTYQERRRELVRVIVEHEHGTLTDEIECIVRP